jgi:acyl carrier protein
LGVATSKYMTEDKLTAAIAAVFQRLFEVPAETVKDQTRRGQLERWDSLGHLLLIEALCEAFKVEIPPEKALEMESVQDIKRVLSSLGVESDLRPS